MAFADSSQSVLVVGLSQTVDTEPGTYKKIEPVSHSLSIGAGSFQSEQIRAARKPLDNFRTDTRGEGNIVMHWQADVIDDFLSAGLHDTIGTAVATTGATVTFGTPDAVGIQTVALTVGNATNTNKGDFVTIAGAVDATNNGTFLIQDWTDDQTFSIHNPAGAPETGDTGVSFTNAGTYEIGSDTQLLFVEREHRLDASTILSSDFYQNGRVGQFTTAFRASAPSQVTVELLTDLPTFTHKDGGATEVRQRATEGNNPSANRLIHGMEDVTKFWIVDPSAGGITNDIDLCNVASSFEFTLNNNIRQDFALCSAAAQNTALGTSVLTGNFSAFLNDTASAGDAQSTQVAELLSLNPDGVQLYFLFGDGTTQYGAWVDGCRVTAAPFPIAGNSQSTLINAEFSGLDLRITKL